VEKYLSLFISKKLTQMKKDNTVTEFKKIVYAVFMISMLIIVGGIYFVAADKFAEVELSILGYNFSSTSIGLSMVFIGAMLVLFVSVRAFKLQGPSGGVGGSAKVIGDGDARGGKGGNSGSFGPGGRGGDAHVFGSGRAKGGEGGDGG
jgi:hypothetical protein